MNSRWTPEQANAWWAKQPWLLGCNYIPSNAINQLEMWQAETFDPIFNDRELGFAASLGMNTARVYLHDLLWEQDAAGFVSRIDQFLTIAHKHRIRPLLVIFDDCWNPHPKLGRQPQPVPARHNSGWVQSPSTALVKQFASGDLALHDRLERYVTGILARFMHDDRILGWDLYNEPGQSGRAADGSIHPCGVATVPLLNAVFDWAQQVRPDQPLTSGWHSDQVPAISRVQLSRSDAISFHSYTKLDKTQEQVRRIESLTDRPVMLCTEFLAREYGSTIHDQLPWFHSRKIGAYTWGLVAGKTNTIYPWKSWEEKMDEPRVWHHDLLRADGSPHDPSEIARMRELTSTP